MNWTQEYSEIAVVRHPQHGPNDQNLSWGSGKSIKTTWGSVRGKACHFQPFFREPVKNCWRFFPSEGPLPPPPSFHWIKTVFDRLPFHEFHTYVHVCNISKWTYCITYVHTGNHRMLVLHTKFIVLQLLMLDCWRVRVMDIGDITRSIIIYYTLYIT